MSLVPHSSKKFSNPPAADVQDENYHRMQEFIRIMKLTHAIDSLVARAYVAEELDRSLDKLESVVAVLEARLAQAQTVSDDLSGRYALIRSTIQLQGEDAEVLDLYRDHGATMREQLERHQSRWSALVNGRE